MPSGQIFGKYEVLRRLAVGGMGEIFLGRQRGVARFDRLVILKTLLPDLATDQDAVNAFLDEAGIVGSINHPNVVGVYEVGEHQGEYIMVMEHIHGVELSQLRKIGAAAKRPMPPHVAAEVVRQAALGLDAAHNAKDARGQPLKIVHRDISPQNIMVRTDGHVKLLDFGVARAELRATRTQGGMLKGKLGYMSPEQITTKPLDGRHDQWSLGVVFWELLAGRRLFHGEDMVALLKSILQSTVPAPSTLVPTVPAILDEISLRMLRHPPEERFPTLGETARVLRAAIENLQGHPDDLARYVKDVASEQLENQMKVLLTEAPEAPLKSAGDGRRACARCGVEQPRANRFCASCGKPFDDTQSSSVPRGTGKKGAPAPVMIQDNSESWPASPRPAPAPVPVGAEPKAASPADSERTLPITPGVPPAPPGPAAPASAPFAAVPPTGAGARPETRPDAKILQNTAACVALVRVMQQEPPAARVALAERARAHGGICYTVDGGYAVVFGLEVVGPSDADRALSFALDVAGALAPSGASARVAVARGELRAADAALAGVALDIARALVAAGEPGVVVEEGVRSALGRRLAAGRTFPFTGPRGAGRAVDVVGGAMNRPAPLLVVGRDEELAAVAEALAGAQRRRGGLLLIHGSPGVGKSALLNELAPLCAWQGMLVARASASLRVAAPPFDVVRQLCRSLLAALAADWQRGQGGGDLEMGMMAAGLGAGDRARLLNLFSVTPFTESVTLSRRAAALRASVARLVLAAARGAGVCLIVDDADLVDRASSALLEALAHRLERERALLIVATNRPWQPAAAGVRALQLLPLDERSIDRLVEDAVGPMAPAVAAQVRAAASGNPRAALCAAGALAAAGAMVRANGRWETGSGSGTLEPGVEAVVGALVRRLSLQSRAYLCAVAVAGGAVPDDARVIGAYDEAVALGLVPPRQGRPVPLSPTVQRALVASAEATGPAFLRELHDISAARARQRLERDPASVDVLAYHRRLSEPQGLAVDEHVDALARHGALGVVEPLLDTGISLCGAVARDRVRPKLGIAGEPILDVAALAIEACADADADAAACARAADELCTALAQRAPSAGLARICRARAKALARAGRPAEVEPALSAAAVMAAAGHAPAVEAALLVDLARCAEARADRSTALRFFQDAIALEPEAGPGDEGAPWTAPLGAAAVFGSQGNAAEAQAAFARAATHAAAVPVAEAELCLARAALERGASADAHVAAGIAAADRAGDVVLQVEARVTCAQRLAAGGRIDAARALLAEAVEVARDALYQAGVDVATRALATLAAGMSAS